MPSIGIEVMILPANIPADEVLEKNLTLRSLGEGRSLSLPTKVEAERAISQLRVRLPIAAKHCTNRSQKVTLNHDLLTNHRTYYVLDVDAKTA
jgi:hypothetical protein